MKINKVYKCSWPPSLLNEAVQIVGFRDFFATFREQNNQV